MLRYVFIFAMLFSPQSYATDMVGALSAGMGGTGRAAVESNESVYLNPASLALLDKFYTGASYLSGFTDRNISRNTYSVVLSDGTQDLMIPGSLSYRSHRINNRGTHMEEDEFKVGLGFRAHEQLSFGLAGTFLRAENEAGQGFDQNNFDVGMLIGLQPQWGLSVSAENVIRPNEEIPDALARPSRVSLGTQYVFDRVATLRYEALMPLYTENALLLGHRLGASISMRGHFFLNAGYSVDDNIGQNWASVGLAWKGPRLKLAYSLQAESRADLGNRHFVDLWLNL
jgi:hypothetical protein